MTPLMYAVASAGRAKNSGLFGAPLNCGREGFISTADLLIANRADLRAKNQDGSTALMLAAESQVNTQPMVKHLMRKNNVNDRNRKDSNRTVLMEALLEGGVDGALALLESKDIKVNLRDINGGTAFMYAASLAPSCNPKAPDKRVLETLLGKLSEKGARINDEDDAGNTALCYVKAGQADLAAEKKSSKKSNWKLFGKSETVDPTIAVLKSLGAMEGENGCNFGVQTYKHLKAHQIR
jgi:ankyrin repeat protein